MRLVTITREINLNLLYSKESEMKNMDMNLSQEDLEELKQLVEYNIKDLRGVDGLLKMRSRFSNRAKSVIDVKNQQDEQVEYYELLKVKINMKLG